jgi:hypothetical protein
VIKKRSNKPINYLIAKSDIAHLREDLKFFHSLNKNLVNQLKTIQESAEYNPEGLKKLSLEQRAELEAKKRDALVYDLATAVEYLSLSSSLCAEYAIRASYASQYVSERLIQLEKSVEKIAAKTGVDISSLQTEVVDLKETILPATKRMVDLFDKLDKETKQKKNNGDVMVV